MWGLCPHIFQLVKKHRNLGEYIAYATLTGHSAAMAETVRLTGRRMPLGARVTAFRAEFRRNREWWDPSESDAL